MLHPSFFIEELFEICRLHAVPCITPVAAEYLGEIITLTKPKILLEIGTAQGYSTLQFAQKMGPGDTILTFEHSDPSFYIAQQNIQTYQKLRNQQFPTHPSPKIHAFHGDFRQIFLEKVQNLGVSHFDLVFIDAMKKDYLVYLQQMQRFLHENTVIIADDVIKFHSKMDPVFFEWFGQHGWISHIIPLDEDDGILIAFRPENLIAPLFAEML